MHGRRGRAEGRGEDRELSTPEDIEALRRVYDEHWSHGDWSPNFEFYAADFEWGWSPEFPGLAGVFHDTETPNPRLRTWLSPWEKWTCVAEDYIEVPADQFVVLARYRGVGKGSGAQVDVEGAHVWRVVNGRAKRLEVFATRSAALASVGLNEKEPPPEGDGSS